MPNAFKVYFQHDTRATVWLPHNSKVKNLSHLIEIPARSLVLADSGALAYDGTLILDIQVPVGNGFITVAMHVYSPHGGDISFFAKNYLVFKEFEFASLVSSLMKN